MRRSPAPHLTLLAFEGLLYVPFADVAFAEDLNGVADDTHDGRGQALARTVVDDGVDMMGLWADLLEDFAWGRQGRGPACVGTSAGQGRVVFGHEVGDDTSSDGVGGDAEADGAIGSHDTARDVLVDRHNKREAPRQKSLRDFCRRQRHLPVPRDVGDRAHQPRHRLPFFSSFSRIESRQRRLIKRVDPERVEGFGWVEDHVYDNVRFS